MHYKLISNLTRIETIENFNAVLDSKYFKEYDFKNEAFKLFSGFKELTIRGFPNKEEDRLTKLKDVTDLIKSQVHFIDYYPSSRQGKIELYLTTPDEFKIRFGFDSMIRDKLKMCLGISSEKITGSNDWSFSVVNYGLLNMEKDPPVILSLNKANYLKWYHELDKELKAILPYFPEKRFLVE